MFCSKCGGKMAPVARAEPEAPREPEPREPEPPEPEPEPKKKASRRVAGAARTMMGMPGPDREELIRAAKEATAAKKARAGDGVMRGAAPTVRDAFPRGAQAASDESGAGELEAGEAESGEPGAGGVEPPRDAPVEPPRRRAVGAARTMLGMPAPGQSQIKAGIEEARKRAAEKASGAEPERRPSASLRTAPGIGEEPGEPSAPVRKRALDPNTNRTMLGQPAPRLDTDKPSRAPSARVSEPPRESRPSGPPDKRGRAEVLYPSVEPSIDAEGDVSLVLPQRRLPKGVAIGVLVIGVAVLIAGAVALGYSLLGTTSPVSASVVQGESGEELEIHVAGASEGTRVRFRGEEQPLAAGRARFALAADALTLGENELSVDILSADGSVDTDTVLLQLDLRVRADLGPLQGTPPAIDVVVEAPSGSEVTLDGDALTLDDRGRGTRRFPVDPSAASAEGMVEHVVRYRVQPPDGETAQGELRTRIPHTTMQIDRPGARTVTDRETVTVAGAVGPNATVTIDGAEVVVNAGRFLAEVALAEVGERTVEVIAREPGKAPRIARLEVRRVADLAAEAASFEANAELTYARISQNPATYRGQNVAFVGVVYNVVVREGHSQLQILVEECPEGERCPLWIDYASATNAELRQRVRVLGSVAGEQQFRSQSGQIRTVPSVEATFVLDAPTARRR